MNKWAIVVKVGKTFIEPIYVKTGIYQGDTISPLTFILLTAHIAAYILNNIEITRACRGRQEIAAFMDDYKTHAPSKRAAMLIKDALQKAAAEVGLSLNERKCGTYCAAQEDDQQQEQEEDMPFLPVIREGYKYLDLHQLDRDAHLNLERLTDRTYSRTRKILDSTLSPAQKVQLYNSTVIPVAVYIMGNLYPNESRPTSLKRCRDLDKEIRKLLIEYNMLGKSTTKSLVYLSTDLSGIGLKSIEFETELQYVRKGVYLQHHQEMIEITKRYERLAAKGW